MKNKKPTHPAQSQRDVDRIAKAIAADMRKPRPIVLNWELIKLKPLTPIQWS